MTFGSDAGNGVAEIQLLLEQLDAQIRRDPARRGLIATESQLGPLCPGHLAAAAADIAERGRHVLIATGFFIPGAEPPAAETDGPPGALLLAETLRRAGIETTVVTDRHCHNAVRVAAQATGFPVDCVHDEGSYLDTSKGTETTRFSHLIAIERVGPSHTVESLVRQPRSGQAPVEQFSASVPVAARNCCHNMRGEPIDQFAGQVHRLFDQAGDLFPGVRTIGIGDGGNEIGMGMIPWEELVRRLAGDPAARIPCRIPCDWNVIAGVSNWGAYALAAGVLHLRGQVELLEPFTAEQQRCVLEALVAHGPAVDGVTRRREATVDGLSLSECLAPWERMRALCGVG